jgi:1-acyl-sn-glycerol-3-phosphate acyltransferase
VGVDHLERFPLVPKVLEKLGAILIDNCCGPEARKDLAASFAKVADDKRIVLIYPEGHLTQVGEHKRIRAGVCHMQDTSQWPVLPVATSLGLRWQEQDRQVSRARCDRVSRSNSTGSWQK